MNIQIILMWCLRSSGTANYSNCYEPFKMSDWLVLLIVCIAWPVREDFCLFVFFSCICNTVKLPSLFTTLLHIVIVLPWLVFCSLQTDISCLHSVFFLLCLPILLSLCELVTVCCFSPLFKDVDVLVCLLFVSCFCSCQYLDHLVWVDLWVVACACVHV